MIDLINNGFLHDVSYGSTSIIDILCFFLCHMDQTIVMDYPTGAIILT